MKSEIIELGERSVRNLFEHRMSTYAAALAYRGLFGVFAFMLILVVLAGALGLPDLFDRLTRKPADECRISVAHARPARRSGC